MLAETRGIITLNELRNRSPVFRDRAHAGEVLAGMLAHRRGDNAVVLGIPAGGVPVAAVIARQMQWPLDVAVVSKITLPWNTEAGYGAVAFDGSVRLNEALIARVALSRHVVEAGIGRTREKVERRAQLLRHDKPFPDLNRLGVILVDDGLASGFTLETAHCGPLPLHTSIPFSVSHVNVQLPTLIVLALATATSGNASTPANTIPISAGTTMEPRPTFFVVLFIYLPPVINVERKFLSLHRVWRCHELLRSYLSSSVLARPSR